jgi:hypothetical protein
MTRTTPTPPPARTPDPEPARAIEELRAAGALAPRVPVTTAAYLRSHGRAPRGSGTWAFSASQTSRAYDADLRGNVVFAHGTLAEATRVARESLRGVPYIAVLP